MSEGLTIHGGRLAEARKSFGGEPQDWLDLSTGINPDSWPQAETMPVDWLSLPDPQSLCELEAHAAAYFGVDPALCCAVPGSEAGLRLVAHILGLPGRCLPLSYSSHADAFEARGSSRPGAASAFVIANPNNPDGKVTPHAKLFDLLERQGAEGGWLIVDEAFADCRADWSIAPSVHEDRQLIVLRSFGKFFGLAGVRLGFVLAPPAILAQLRRLLGEWPVCSAALSFGAGAYADAGWISATRSALPERAVRLDAVLMRHGLVAKGECPLFRLVETKQAQEIFMALARRHILIRPFAAYRQLLRFGLPESDSALARLDCALAESVHHG